MASVGHELKIKYGLRSDPSPDAVQEWAKLTRNFISQGLSREAAGGAAAKQLFPDFRTHIYASEADTIEMLLQQIGDKK